MQWGCDTYNWIFAFIAGTVYTDSINIYITYHPDMAVTSYLSVSVCSSAVVQIKSYWVLNCFDYVLALVSGL